MEFSDEQFIEELFIYFGDSQQQLTNNQQHIPLVQNKFTNEQGNFNICENQSEDEEESFSLDQIEQQECNQQHIPYIQNQLTDEEESFNLYQIQQQECNKQPIPLVQMPLTDEEDMYIINDSGRICHTTCRKPCRENHCQSEKWKLHSSKRSWECRKHRSYPRSSKF